MGTAIRKTAEKSSEKLFKLMKFCTVPNFHLTDLSLYHIILCPDLRRGCENALRHPGSCRAAFTLDTYTHTTGDMQKRAAEIVDEFLTDIFGEELKPWQENEKTEKELSA